MRSLKLLLVAAVFCSAFVACEKQDLNEDELMLNEVDVVSVTTGGQVDNDGGID
ncbi:MAG: hypothetical protein HKO81_00985 [Flavobacteriaceae bacterium]|nr:hypothetical protein [Bacteroidia bacterium]NNL15198.1 hypothetical protein [Flavobacteriaceae bacterium]